MVDTVVPTVASVSSSASDGNFIIGDVIPITVTFSEAVIISGTPQLTLETGSNDAVVNYTSGSGSTVLVFNYTVVEGHTASDLDYGIGTRASNSGTINDQGSPATLTLPSPGATNSLGSNKALVIDGVIPTITNVTSTTNDGTYKSGDVIAITVTFSEVVNVVTTNGTPTLTLETGDSDASVNYASGSGSNTLTFNYTIADGQNSSDLDYASTSALALNSGTIKDVAGNGATLTLASPGASNSLGANKAIVVDSTIPVVRSVTSTTSNGNYSVNTAIPIKVVFSEAVIVSGSPTPLLETGSSDAILKYSSGSGSNELIFNYTVASGHQTSDLDYVSNSALELNGGLVNDALAVNVAVLTLPAPGANGSLSANKEIVIDTALPSITSVTSNTADGTYKASETIIITINLG